MSICDIGQRTNGEGMKAGVLTLLVAVLSAVPTFACAEASAIACGSDDSCGWATRKTQQEADKEALKRCNGASPNMDCVISVTKAVVRAKGGHSTGYARSALSLADARKRAIASCGNAQCKVTLEVTKPGFYSLAESESDKNGNGNYYIAYEYDNSDEADRDAIQGCNNVAGRKCKVLWSGAIAGNYNRSAAPSPLTVASDIDCRPTTPTVRCSSQCNNGNCVVTYENGCKINVQVQPRFDGLSNQWTYPAPGC